MNRLPPSASAPIFAGTPSPLTARPRRAPVTHDFAALSFYVDGGARIEQRGEWTLEPGDVLLVPAGQPHRWLESRRPTIRCMGFCVPCLAPETAPVLLEPFERVRDGAAPVVRIPAERHAFLDTLFRELEATSDGARDASLRQGLLTLILGEVGRAAVWEPAARSERGVVAESLRVIERRCLGPLTLNDVAAAVQRTPSYVTTALTRATGRSAVAWIIAHRMAEARRRLLHSDERVETIAERVGYADPTHFIRMFRRAHGVTPAAWRAAQRQATGR